MDMAIHMECLNYFKALSDSTRIRIYSILLTHELSVNELVALLEMGQSRVSRHLKILSDSGLLNCRRSGVWAFYSAARNENNIDFLNSVTLLFKREAELRQDSQRALSIIEERSHKTRQFFNTIAHKWDRLKQDILSGLDLNQAIIEITGPCSDAVDLGCGTGELLEYLKSVSQHVIGVDSSSSMLEEAGKRFSEHDGIIDLRLGELEHLPVGNGEADLAVISLALHHMSIPSAAVAEAGRVLRVGGQLVVAEFERHDNEVLRDLYGDRWLGFTEDEITKWAAESGFGMKEIRYFELQQSLKLVLYKFVKQ